MTDAQPTVPGAAPDDRLAALPVERFCTELAARRPAPGGGGVAALEAALAASLVAMAARFTTGEQDPDRADERGRITEAADRIRTRALEAVQEDADAFEQVSAAYALPRESDEEQARRRQALAARTATAARTPAAVIGLAGELLDLVEGLLPRVKPLLVSDLAIAASSARAAAVAGRISLHATLPDMDDGGRHAALEASTRVEEIAARADAIERQIRARTLAAADRRAD